MRKQASTSQCYKERRLKRLYLGISLLLVCSLAFASHKRVLVIGIDGLKGTELDNVIFKKQQAPTIHKLMKHGRYTRCRSITDPFCAHTHDGFRIGPDYSWVTASGWVTVITGVNTIKHQVKGNAHEEQSVFFKSSQHYPSFFTYAQQDGLTTAASGVGCFLTSNSDGHQSNGITDYECGIGDVGPLVEPDATSSCNLDSRLSLHNHDPDRDLKLSQWLVTQIQGNTDVIMGVFDQVDSAGHHYGFGNNTGYHQAIIDVDAKLEKVMLEVSKRVIGFDESWLIVLTSDHGGHQTSHDRGLFDDEVIPFIVAIYDNHFCSTRLNVGHLGKNIRQMDAAATILDWLDINGKALDGVSRIQSYRL